MKNISVSTMPPNLDAPVPPMQRFRSIKRTFPLIAVFLCLLIHGVANGQNRSQKHTDITLNLHNAQPGRQIPQSFLGFSMEYFRGGVAKILTPANGQQEHIINLFDNLGRLNGPPMLRLGGNSADSAWWDPNGLPNPRGVRYRITPSLVKNVNGLIRSTGTKLIVGLNLGYPNPSLAAAWAHAAVSQFGSKKIAAFEIGNEPNLFPHHGVRPRSYNFKDYSSDFNTWLQALKPVFNGHTWAAGPALAGHKWTADLPHFIREEHGSLALVTQHNYAMNACAPPRRAPKYASIANLLSPQVISPYVDLMRPIVSAASAYDIPVRVDEMSYMLRAGCKGPTASGSSIRDTFASALWTADVLFELAHTGVSGVNFQTTPRRGGNVPASFYTNPDGTVSVAPMYYGMIFFAEAVQDHAHFLRSNYAHHSSNQNVKIWTTEDDDGNIRIAVINKNLSTSAHISVRLPGIMAARQGHPMSNLRRFPTARLLRLTAASASATTGVSLGGQTFGPNGLPVGSQATTKISGHDGVISFTVSEASAALVTIPGARK
jgi:hypothetical protein